MNAVNNIISLLIIIFLFKPFQWSTKIIHVLQVRLTLEASTHRCTTLFLLSVGSISLRNLKSCVLLYTPRKVHIHVYTQVHHVWCTTCMINSYY